MLATKGQNVVSGAHLHLFRAAFPEIWFHHNSSLCANTQAFPWIMNPPEHDMYRMIHIMTLMPSPLNSPTQSPRQLWNLDKSCWSILSMLGTGGHGLRSMRGSFNSTCLSPNWNLCQVSWLALQLPSSAPQIWTELSGSASLEPMLQPMSRRMREMKRSSFAARRRNKGHCTTNSDTVTREFQAPDSMQIIPSRHPTLEKRSGHDAALTNHLFGFNSGEFAIISFLQLDYFKSAICQNGKHRWSQRSQWKRHVELTRLTNNQALHEQKPCNLGLLANSNHVSFLSFQDQIRKNWLPLNTRNSYESTISWNH